MGVKVLIVDDEPLVRKSLSRACRAKGHEVFEASDGREGLSAWLETEPDVVFVDVLMPGLSGPELLREIAEIKSTGKSKSLDQEETAADVKKTNFNWDRRQKVILMSAYSGEHNIATAQQIGAHLFIPKPFEDVFAVVSKAEELFSSSEAQ